MSATLTAEQAAQQEFDGEGMDCTPTWVGVMNLFLRTNDPASLFRLFKCLDDARVPMLPPKVVFGALEKPKHRATSQRNG